MGRHEAQRWDPAMADGDLLAAVVAHYVEALGRSDDEAVHRRERWRRQSFGELTIRVDLLSRCRATGRAGWAGSHRPP